MARAMGRAFRERQIYHRSDGVVRFVKLSSQTQMAMALILGAFLLWVAFATVNFVFEQQIKIAEAQQRRDERAAFQRRLQSQETAYDEVSALNYVYAREFDAAISNLRSQTDTLRGLMDNKGAIDGRLQGLSDTLSETGAPGGQPMKSGNRVMVDPIGREPTPRQSRVSSLRRDALTRFSQMRVTGEIDDAALSRMRLQSADLSARQLAMMGALEEDTRIRIEELAEVLRHTGVDMSGVVDAQTETLSAPLLASLIRGPKDEAAGEAEPFTGQGGPLIPADDLPRDPYTRTAARVARTLGEAAVLTEAVKVIPLSAPVKDRHRMTSRFGVRWDPVKKNRRAQHKGLDFAARTNTPILATAPGRVTFAGVRGGYGRCVEIDHGNGFKTRYGHMNAIKVRTGQKVELHDVIGLMGSTGRSTGTHVHYEVHYRGRQVDPLKFIEAGRYVFES
ncbi:murein DD-endopeptidase MepM/ murein hydrolase activator NlpD [Parvularcula dongshanensis]|uniref:Murein DD-endopeptidase MepM/ murein hydrolase activator NlpD n=2 Tax=Parvularcula dongshanensis TaxID=1173995 RepID=A0A840I5V7_9PROT|nr:murein DD-endopeptidase MepM/ murein hydrolase activator NlpD [Parvularcula dongshanensis]